MASPIDWKKKLINTGFAALALLTLILLKTLLLTLFSIANTQIGIYTLSESQLSWVFHIISAMTLGFSVMFVFAFGCSWDFEIRNSTPCFQIILINLKMKPSFLFAFCLLILMACSTTQKPFSNLKAEDCSQFIFGRIESRRQLTEADKKHYLKRV